METWAVGDQGERFQYYDPETNASRFGPQDGEQNIPHLLYEGLDHPDFLIVRAPKPAMMITATNDFFSIQGAMESEKEVSLIYNAYGKPFNFSRVEDFGVHQITVNNREALYTFFQDHLDNPGLSMDEEVETLTEDELRVTATGQLSTSLGSETMFSLNRKEAEGFAARLEESRSDLDSHLPAVAGSARELSGYREPQSVGDPVLTGKYRMDDYVLEKYFVWVDGDYVVPFVWYIPDEPPERVLLYIHPNGNKADSAGLEEIKWFVSKGSAVLAPDLLGTGETYPEDYRGDSYMQHSSLNIWFTSILIYRSIAGIRAADVHSLVGLAEKRFPGKDVCALANGEMAPVLLHAAVMDPSLKRKALIEPLSSYISIARKKYYSVKFVHNVVPGAVREYDLPDLGACLALRSLLVVNVAGGAGEMLEENELAQEVTVIRRAYEHKDADKMLTIRQGVCGRDRYELYLKWMDHFS